MNQTLPLAEYGLDSARVAELDGHGAINQVYNVESPAGVFVLKEYSGISMDTARLQQLCDIQAALRTAGMPIPKVRQTSDGRAFCNYKGRFFLMTDYVAGHTFPGGNMPDEAAFRLGVTHAKLLSLLAAIPGATPQELPDLEATEAHLRALLAIGGQRRGQDARDEASCLQLEQKLRMLQAWQGPAPKVRAQWTHGDYTWRNVLFDGDDEVAAIVDFDNLRSSDPGRDVMRCVTLSFPHGSPAALSYFGGYTASSRIMPEEARRYVNVYHYMSIYGVWPIDVDTCSPISIRSAGTSFCSRGASNGKPAGMPSPAVWLTLRLAFITRRWTTGNELRLRMPYEYVRYEDAVHSSTDRSEANDCRTARY